MVQAIPPDLEKVMKPLTIQQQSILYSLLSHMVNEREVNFATSYANEAPQPSYLTAGRKIIEGLSELSALLPGASGPSADKEPKTPAGVLTKAVSTLFLSGMLESHQYLAKHFAVERSPLYFPGITSKDASSEDDDDALFEREPGELTVEFPDEESRSALIDELEAWASRDSGFVEQPDGTLARVRVALATTALVAA